MTEIHAVLSIDAINRQMAIELTAIIEVEHTAYAQLHTTHSEDPTFESREKGQKGQKQNRRLSLFVKGDDLSDSLRILKGITGYVDSLGYKHEVGKIFVLNRDRYESIEKIAETA